MALSCLICSSELTYLGYFWPLQKLYFFGDILERIEILLTCREVANWGFLDFYCNNYQGWIILSLRKYWLHVLTFKEDSVNQDNGYGNWKAYLKGTVKIIVNKVDLK